jgi:hypothetical protein
MIDPIYKLSQEERRLAERIGKARNNAKHTSFRNSNCRGLDSEHSHILGASSEIAYASIINKKIDENIYPFGDDTDFPGLRKDPKKGIDLKTSLWPYIDIELKIKMEEYMRKIQLAYILTRTDKNYTTVEFIGSISREKFDRIKYKKTHRFDNWCVSGEQLSKGLAFIEDDTLKIVRFKDKYKI